MIERADSSEQRIDLLTSILAHLLQNGYEETVGEVANSCCELVPPPRAAAALLTALAMCPLGLLPAETEASLLQERLAEFPDDIELRFCAANWKLMRGEYLQAAEWFRHCLEQDPQHLVTRNNLALALALESDQGLAEARELLTGAIQQGGEQPLLMDTLAVLHLRKVLHKMLSRSCWQCYRRRLPTACCSCICPRLGSN